MTDLVSYRCSQKKARKHKVGISLDRLSEICYYSYYPNNVNRISRQSFNETLKTR